MKSIKLGKNIEASKIAYGCMRLGGKSKEEAKSSVLTAIEYGVNFFDNADIYNNGVSEQYFGEAIKGIDRESIFVQSKCGIRKGFYDFSKEHIVSSVEGSLKRIGVDYLDVLCLHRPDVLMKGEEVAEAFDTLYSRGLVKNFGVSNFNPMQVEYLKKYTDFPLVANQLQLGLFHTGMIDSWMCANMHNSFAVDKDGSVLPYSMLNDMVIQAWGPMRSDNGIFTENEALAEKMPLLQKWADKYGISKDAMAIAFINQLDIVQPIIGTTNVDRIKDQLSCCDIEIEKSDWYHIYTEMGNLVP
ncbi:MAG: aldo/keto reductase [Eubacterium sp.]|nr:aldo/keto reductase [Eubacterium sp.]